VEDLPASRAVQADHVAHERALAPAAVSHDHEDLAASHRERHVPLDDRVAVRHGELPYLQLRSRRPTGRHRPSPCRNTVAIASTTTTSTMPITTALVVASPT